MSRLIDKEAMVHYLRMAAIGYGKLKMKSKQEICNNLIDAIESGEWDYVEERRDSVPEE